MFSLTVFGFPTEKKINTRSCVSKTQAPSLSQGNTIKPIAIKKLKDNFDTYAQGNFFPLPKAVFNFDLCAEEIALYAYLMHIEDRKTFTCIAKYSTIGAALKMSKGESKI